MKLIWTLIAFITLLVLAWVASGLTFIIMLILEVL